MVVLAIGLLVGAARRAGVAWQRAALGGATWLAAVPQMDGAFLSAAGLAAAIVVRRHPLAAGLAAAIALSGDPTIGALALFVALAMPLRGAARFVAGLAAGGLIGLAFGPPLPVFEVWPWFCGPRRLGNAMPLSWIALGLGGMALAVRGRPGGPLVTAVTRIAPLATGIVVAWLGTYHPPRPPLYNLPGGLAMWGLGASAAGACLFVARGGSAGPELRMALGLGLGAASVTALRTVPLGPGPVCGQLLASPAVVWLLALALVRLVALAAARHPGLGRWLDGALASQVLWLAGFVL